MTEAYLHTGHDGPLTAADSGSIQLIADALAGSGLEAVRLDYLETAAIHVALKRAKGNRTYAARLLNISLRTLQRKLKAAHVDGEPA